MVPMGQGHVGLGTHSGGAYQNDLDRNACPHTHKPRTLTSLTWTYHVGRHDGPDLSSVPDPVLPTSDGPTY